MIEKIGNRFRTDVKRFAEREGIPIWHLKKPDRSRWDDRKLDHLRTHLDRAERVASGHDPRHLFRIGSGSRRVKTPGSNSILLVPCAAAISKRARWVVLLGGASAQ